VRTGASLAVDSRIDAMDASATSRGPRLFALVPCAGSGVRACTQGPKQYVQLAGQALVGHTLTALKQVPRLHGVMVMLAPDDRSFEREVPGFAGPQSWVVRNGGRTRAATVANGLNALREQGAADADWVLVHDAARALLRPEWVDRLIDACLADAVGGLLALPVADTLKAERDGRSAATVDRRDKWAAQTPQMFRIGVLGAALARAGDGVTDEAGAIEAMGLQPRLVTGDAANIKITWPEDLARAQALLAARGEGADTVAAPLHIGEGWDVHALVAGRPLVLGGVTIPHSHGLLAHSDGDALLHAIVDALFGAAGLGDIGRHFPDTDPAFRGADSIVLLRSAGERVRSAGFQIVNIDSTIIAQAPRLSPHVDAMRERIAAALALDPSRVNVKAKTAEKMGPVGEGLAIEARAVCLLQRRGG
jgi:2-C-methyl-D-erythritol 4-phosphate cytidylyltransferase / 2-C-methyl-D-erythritol 2,4-cyclodiphosphate synthase